MDWTEKIHNKAESILNGWKSLYAIIYSLANEPLSIIRIKCAFNHFHWQLKQLGLYYLLFHCDPIRKQFKDIHWHHYLGCHYGKSFKWF